MYEKERVENVEQILFQSWNTFRALRSVGFLLSQTEGKGAFQWEGQGIEDLSALIDVLAQRGVDHTDAGLEEMRGFRTDKLKTDSPVEVQ